ncbi:MAG TPA: hypothetical protein PK419_03860 [Spirochaetota bacterium]|nr:hypothetical protein [Spirochaetota bacterium]
MRDYENRVIAYIDIMGFKELIAQSIIDKTKLYIIQTVVQYLKSWETTSESKWNTDWIDVEEDAQKKGLNYFRIKEKTACTCFSDTIVVSVQMQNDNINAILSTLISILSFIGSRLLLTGILWRGAITIGQLMHSNDNVII